MSQLRASINFSLRGKELNQHQLQFLNSNAVLVDDPDFEEFGVSAPNPNVENEDNEESDDDIEDDDTNIVTSEHWERELRKWKEMLMEEELARMEEEEALRDNSNISMMKGDILSEYTHPAIDKKAKWKLGNLFSTSLNVPNYLDH